MKDEERLIMQYAVTRALAESATLDEATPKMLRAICESLGWQLGALWIVAREADGLRCLETWHAPDVEVAEFETMNRESVFKRGEGFPGHVWAEGEPVWVTDIAASDFPRSAVAARSGLHATFGFPVLLGGQTLGVMEFFSRQALPPDEALLNMMASLGSQIGQFIERKRSEVERERSEQRYRLLTEVIPQQVWTAQPDGALDYVNRRVLDYFGRTMEEMLGWGWQNVLHPDDVQPSLERWRASLQTGEPYKIEFRLRRASDSSYRWHLGQAMPLRDDAGKVVAWFGTNTDIEEQKLIEATLARINRERAQMLEEVSTPVVPVWRDVLVVPIIGSLDTERMNRATQAALGEVVRTGARACIIDITGARVVDSHAIANLSNLVSSLKLIGAEAIVTGVTAQAAQSLVGLGVDFTGMRTYRTLAEALASWIKSTGLNQQTTQNRVSSNGNGTESR
ncbi:MAG TPA: GAF domain-containing protein [Pyrinomonadaceae bacterium]